MLGEGLDQGVRAVIRDHEVQPDLRQQRPLSFGHRESIVATISGGSSRSSATASRAQHGPGELLRQPLAAAD